MTRVAFPPSPSRRPVTIPVGDGAVPVEDDTSATAGGAVAEVPAFNIGDVVLTHWGANFAEGVVIGYSHDHGIYTVAVAHKALGLFPAARYADELEAVVW